MLYKTKKRLVSIILVFCLLLSITIGGGALTAAQAATQTESYTAKQLADKAVQFINDRYKAGEKIDGYTAYVLTLAGEDLSSEKWSRNGESLKEEIQKTADLLGNHNSMITYILATQNADGSFGPYANEYGTKAPLQALAMVKNEITDSNVKDQVQNSISKAVTYFKDRYLKGSLAYDAQGWSFDYRCVEALSDAGEDLSKWVYGGKSLKDIVITSADAAASNASVFDAVYLAKELIALRAVDPKSNNIDTLAQAIAEKKKTDGNSIYFGNSIYDNVMVLTALGKAGKLNLIDQQQAFNYLNKFRRPHKGSWGNEAGVAWGGYYPEEPDLTAQVLTALSYFDAARDTSSDIYNAIQGGLTYLQDIQDAETAAIKAQWDSTFATAETLIALKSLGKTYNDYAGADSTWVKRSKTKTIAQQILVLNLWGDANRVNRLVNLLKERHSSKGFDNSVYSDMWAYIALGEAEKINEINTAEARSYMLGKQSLSGDTSGAWGEVWDGVFFPDFMSTAQAIRALTYLPNASEDKQVQDAVEKGLAYLKKQLQPDGSVYTTQPYPDDPVVDTAEVIVTLKKLGMDPADWKSSQGFTPVDYMMQKALNSDGSFGAMGNILDAAEALSTFILIDGEVEPTGSSQPVSNQFRCTVDIAVVGKDGELLFGPRSVTVRADRRWGLTALGALDATGLDYVDDNGFVKSIEGQANSGMNGWMYKVNGKVPSVLASKFAINDGDEIIWWYSTDINSTGPTWEELVNKKVIQQQEDAISSNFVEQNKKLPQALQVSDEALKALEKIDQLLEIKANTKDEVGVGETGKSVVIVGNREPFKRSEFLNLKEMLLQNTIDLEKKVTASTGAIIVDNKEEIALIIPAGALKKDEVISVKETSLPSTEKIAGNRGLSAVPAGYKALSGIYEFGPDGTSFTVPVTVAIRIAISPLVKPENLVLAWYDKAGGRWAVIPAVVDLQKGVILAKLEHFSEIAVFAKEVKKSFADVNEASFGWARDAVEALGGAGIVTGVDGTRFEPGRAVTRAEFVCLLVRALGLVPKTGGKKQFKDVREDAWYEKAVYAVADWDIVNGYEDGTFRPDSTITREEIAVILARSLGLASSGKKPDFKDKKLISSWSEESIAAAVAGGLLKGFEDGTFRPKAAAGRAETAVIIYRIMGGE